MPRSVLIIALLFAPPVSTLFAQQSQPSSDAAIRGVQALELYRERQIPLFMNDFGNLGRYREANAALPPPVASERRVVFMGDSITDGWKLPEYFPGKPYVNRGISGQTTAQMLVRFRQDVIDLKPKVVVILAGTNDIAGNTGPMSLADIEANYASMAELARAHQIGVVFSSVMPTNNYSEHAAELYYGRETEKILELNRWIKNYCDINGAGYLDYFNAMADSRNMMKSELAIDGLHPNDAGYRIMAPLAQKAIEEALRGSGASAAAQSP